MIKNSENMIKFVNSNENNLSYSNQIIQYQFPQMHCIIIM